MAVLSAQVRDLETERNTAYASQVQAMTRTSTRLTDRTDELATGLRSPQIRGRWGEVQPERGVELGGLVRPGDFNSQVSARLGDKVVRPDLVVQLSGGRQLIVDAKVPFGAYLAALETRDPEETVGYLRRQEDPGDKAREVYRLGRELFTRLGTMGDPYQPGGSVSGQVGGIR